MRMTLRRRTSPGKNWKKVTITAACSALALETARSASSSRLYSRGSADSYCTILPNYSTIGLSYSDLTISNFGAIRHRGFDDHSVHGL